MTPGTLFKISPSSGVPIYRQIMEQTEHGIATQALRPGDPLPSVRHLAEALEINPMTISKAYMLLESQGVLERLRGQGMRVAERKVEPLTPEEKLARLEPAARQLLALAHQMHLTHAQLLEYLEHYLKGNRHEP